jgi:colanic acid/amylovoran biosynthesis glycosyltransferase
VDKVRPVAFVSKNRSRYSETFITDTIRSWPGETILLHGDYLPTHGYAKGREFSFLGSRAVRAANRVMGRDPKKAVASRMGRALKELHAAAVLAHYGPSGVEMMETCAELSIPLYVHFHGYDAYRSDVLETYGRRYGELFTHASGIVAVSRAMCGQLRTLGAPADKLRLLFIGVECREERSWRVPGRPVFLFVGRFVEKKSPRDVLRSFRLAERSLPGARLVMAGDGELKAECVLLAGEFGLKDKVEFPGAISRQSVAELLAGCTALVLPSVRPPSGDSEGLPLVVLEAGAAGRAVIATRHGGIPEAVEENVTGILVDEGDFEGIARGMIHLGRDPARAESMGKAAREKISAEFRREDYITNLSRLVSNAGIAAAS